MLISINYNMYFILVFVSEALFLVDSLSEEERYDRDCLASSQFVVCQYCQILPGKQQLHP